MSAGNFKARLRNLSPTGEKHKTTWRFCRTRDMKYSYKFSLVGGRFGNSFFITGTRSPRSSSISSRANRFDTWEQRQTLFVFDPCSTHPSIHPSIVISTTSSWTFALTSYTYLTLRVLLCSCSMRLITMFTGDAIVSICFYLFILQ